MLLHLTAHIAVKVDSVPIYEFECPKCGVRFEEIVKAGQTAPCPQCKSSDVKRLYSPIGEGRVPVGLFGKAAKESDAKRKEREARRFDR
jgi:putative FmdB family regulatory protein